MVGSSTAMALSRKKTISQGVWSTRYVSASPTTFLFSSYWSKDSESMKV